MDDIDVGVHEVAVTGPPAEEPDDRNCDPERCTITISRRTPHQGLVFLTSGNRRHPPTLELPSPLGKTGEVGFEEFLIALVLRPTFAWHLRLSMR
jgi:hypothetical protein